MRKQDNNKGVSASALQDEKLALAVAAKVYLERLSVIWASPLSDANRVKATNQFALPVLTYLMWTQHWPLTELREIDRETRKVVSENGGRHPLRSTALFYLPRVAGGRSMKSVQQEYKLSKIKAAIKINNNLDPMMNTVRAFEEKAEKKGFSSLVKDAHKFSEELGTTLTLEPAESSCSSQSNPEKKITGYHVKLQHRQPKLKMLGVQCNVTYAMLHNYAKRDSRLTTYGGIVLQRFEFVKVCMGRQRLCWKSQLFLYFVNKIYLPCCRVEFFVVCQLRRPI